MKRSRRESLAIGTPSCGVDRLGMAIELMHHARHRIASGRLRLTDFGVAHVVWKTRALGTLAGTPGYMAPEQAMGYQSTRSDVFSLGLVIYRMLTGVVPEWPFAWPPPRVERLRALGPRFEPFLRKALDMDHRKRFVDAQAMLEAFKRVHVAAPSKRAPWAQPETCAWCEHAQGS